MHQPQNPSPSQSPHQRYKISNLKQFPYLCQVKHFHQSTQQSTKSPSFPSFIKNSSKLMQKWFTLLGSDYVLVQFDQNTHQIKLYQNHSKSKNKYKFSQRKLSTSLTINELTQWNDQLIIKLTKNIINGGISYNFKYKKLNFDNVYKQNKNQILNNKTFGLNLNNNKMLSKTLQTNQKKIFFDYHTYINSELQKLVSQIKAGIYIENRQNHIKINKENQGLLGENIVKKNSDIIGYKLITYHKDFGLKLKFQGGVDYFNNSYFQKIHFNYGNFTQLSSHVVQYILNGGIIMGKNLHENDLLSCKKNQFNQIKSINYFQSRINLIYKNFHPIFGSILQILPLFYLSSTISNNLKQIKTKYQIDYGIGIRLLNFNVNIQTSLIKIGKNIDDASSNLKIIF